MEDTRAPNYELALIDYRSGMKYKEIAEKYGVTINTVKSWKTRYKWSKDKKGVHTNSGKVCTQKKVGKQNEKAVAKEVRQVIGNPALTDKQRLFCLHYIRCFNATKAYQKAYEVDYNTAASIGYRLMENAGVREEIARLKQNRLCREMLDEHDIFQKYLDIAYADITDFVEFGREKVQVMGAFGPVEVKDPETGKKTPLLKEVNSVRFHESSSVDGTLIAEVKQGKDGASIKLMDKMKALQWLTDHMGMATEEQRARIEQIQAQTEQLKKDSAGSDEDGVEIINDSPKETGTNIGDSDT